MAVNPYKVPIFSWVRKHGDYTPSVRFVNPATPQNPIDYFPDPALPIFPYFAIYLEEWLNGPNGPLDGFDWRCRWVFENASIYSSDTFDNGREYDPKLVIASQSAAIDWVITFSGGQGAYGPTPLPENEPTYEGLDKNWIGRLGVKEMTLPAANPEGWRTIILDTAPWGVWNPGVLNYGDNRLRENSVAQAVNPLASRHSVRDWGSRAIRTLTMLYVPVSNIFAYRRLDPFYSQTAIRQRSPNNLFEGMFLFLKEEQNTLWIWTAIGDPAEQDLLTYGAGFKGRLGRVLASSHLEELEEAIADATDDGRLIDIAIQVVEGGDLEQVIYPPCELDI